MEAKRKRSILLIALVITGLLAITLASCTTSKAPNGDETDTTDSENQGNITAVTGFQGIAIVRNGYIALANGDGSNERRLTTQDAAYKDLSFSPSAAKLAATKVVSDSMPQLVLVTVDGGKETDVSWTNPDYSTAWASAGVDPWFGNIAWASEDVLYCTAVKLVNDQQRLQLVKYELSQHKITIIQQDTKDPAISSDGKRMVYIQKPADFMQTQGMPWGSDDFGDLIMEDLPNGTGRTLKGNVFEAVFTPESEHMAVVYFDEPDTALQLTDLSATRLYTLSHIGPSGTISHPCFSPAGDRLIAGQGFRESSGATMQKTVFICASNTDNPPQSGLGNGWDPAWSPATQ